MKIDVLPARAFLLLGLLALTPASLAGAAATAGEGESGTSPLATVEAFFAAFNDHDPEAMAELLAPDVRWYSVKDGDVAVEARGREALIEGMRQYFNDLPDVRSSIEQPFVDGPRVVFRERVTWGAGERQQAATAIYRVVDGRISRAWYFSATR